MKRILLLSTIFYPTPSVGSVRITNWARVLPQLGYRPMAICRDFGYRATLENLAANVHPDVQVVQLMGNGKCAPAEDSMERIGAAESGLKERVASRLVAASLHKWVIPESQMLFWNRVYRVVREKASEFRPDVVLATAPAFSVLEVGRRLKRDLNIPFVADYRDSMVPDVRFQPSGLRKVQWPWFARFEKRIYRQADAILHAIPLHGRWARRRYPDARERCAILRHFVPQDLLEGSVPLIRREVPGRRAVSVVGFIRPQIANLLAQAIKTLVNEDPQRFDLELRLIGRPLDDPEPVNQLLGPRVTITGRLRHDLAKQEIASAAVLVNAVNEERQRVIGISSKLYEYAAARKPIISINPTRSDRLMLRELSAIVIERPTLGVLIEALRRTLATDSLQVAESYRDFLQQHNWQQHCRRLAFVLDSVTQQSQRPADLRELDLEMSPQ